jgi:hypothetical protein
LLTRASTPRAPDTNHRRALQVLEAVIKYRWMALPQEQREGIKNYVATVVIKARARAHEPFEAPTVSAEPSFPRRTRALRCSHAHALTPASYARHAARARRCRATRRRSGATGRTSAN